MIWTIGGFSAHAGQSQLLDWLGNFQNKKMPVFLIHGETGAQEVLASLIRQKLGFDVTIPEYMEEIRIKAGIQLEELKQPRAVKQPVNLSPLLDELKAKIDYINNQTEKIQSLPESRQTEIIELLKKAGSNIDEIKPNL